MKEINFFNEDISFLISNTGALKKWITSIIEIEHCQLTSLNYIFCSDQHLWQMNKEYLDHDTYTDIITFDNSDSESEIEGDIFISIDRVKENSENQQNEFNDELYRVMIHGVLHLIGYSDKTPEEKNSMREKEDACLSLLKI